MFTKKENLKNILKRYLNDLIFHNMGKVKPMYRDVFGIDFGEIGWLFEAIVCRHHCVHRAGYDKDGKKVTISKQSLETLMVQSSGSRYFCGSLFWASKPKQAANT
ncbi:hypothetical protein [Solemya pervernicosa gill symbiont]|nr:hypothetical protein [Solemya pervernicosa gill symbiont]